MTGKYKYGYAIHTYGADFIDGPVDLDDATLLELRLFDENGEYRAFRSGKSFKEREIADGQLSGFFPDGGNAGERFIYDEALYLDIDERKSTADQVFATGGGSYHLPEEAKGKDMLVVRYYCEYDCDGVARVTDWRLCGFVCSREWKGAM